MRISIRWLNRGVKEWFRPRAAGCGLFVILAIGASHGAPQRAAGQITPDAALAMTPAGEWLAQFLDRLDVEHHWLRGHEHVAWKSGLPLEREHGKMLTPLHRDETHCSAFAAAVADDLGIYLLHPPEHSHVLLANAQFDWLASQAGREEGWSAVPSALEAQQRANAGELVVAMFKNADAQLAGHIAVVRPAKIAPARVESMGPEVTQAGFTNNRSIDLATGFNHHPGAWLPGGRGAVQFYSHAVDGEQLAGE